MRKYFYLTLKKIVTFLSLSLSGRGLERGVCLFFCLSSFFAQAQPLYSSSNVFLNKTLASSALAGYSGNAESFVSYRRIYNGLKSPYDAKYVSFQTGLGANNGLYAHVYDESYGVFKKTNMQVSFGQRVQLSQDVIIGVGADVNAVNTKIDLDNMLLENYNDPLVQNMNGSNSFQIDMGLGAFTDIKGWLLSISANNLRGKGEQYTYNRSFTGLLSKKLKLSHNIEYDITAVASASKSYKTDVFLNNRFIYHQDYWLNVGVKSGNNISLGAGLVIKKRYALNYSYNMLLQSTSIGKLNTHEIVVGFLIKRNHKTTNRNISIFNQSTEFEGNWTR